MEMDKVISCVTPSGKSLVLRQLIGNDRRKYRRSILDLQDTSLSSADRIDKMEDVLITMVIDSFDGSSENIIERIGQLSIADYDFVLEKVNEVTDGLNKKKEVTSPTNTTVTSEAD